MTQPKPIRRLDFARMLSNAVISQALLSAANFGIGMILIRRATDLQYGSYVLALNALLLLVSLQNAFINPLLATGVHRLDLAGRAALVGGLSRMQHRILAIAGVATMGLALALWGAGVLDDHSAPLVLASAAAALAILQREYFRSVLLARRRPQDVLRTDLVYALLMVGGVWLATWTPLPAVGAVLSLGLAATVGALALARAARRNEPWASGADAVDWRALSPLAAWSAAGAAIHWTFSQGYIFLVAGTLDVTAVAAIAATRLLLMPVNLLSSGIGSLMLPLAAGWLQQHGAPHLLRRLAWLALGLAAVALGYFAGLWALRDWIFAVVLRKAPAQRDALLLAWGALILVMVVRDQLGYLLAAQGRFRAMSLLTLASAAVALSASYLGMRTLGAPGALLGLLGGEVVNLSGIVLLARMPAPLAGGGPATRPVSTALTGASTAPDANSS